MDFSKYKKALVQSLCMNRPRPVDTIFYENTIDPNTPFPIFEPLPISDELREYQRRIVESLGYPDRTYMGIDPARPTENITMHPEREIFNSPELIAIQSEDRSRRPVPHVEITYMGVDSVGKLLDLEPPFEPHYQNRLEACE